MYYPIIDKLKEVMSNLTEQQDDIVGLKATKPFFIDGTITNMSSYDGTWQGQWMDVLTAIRDGNPVYFRIRQTIPNTFEFNINVPVVASGKLGTGDPTDAVTSYAHINNETVYIRIKNDNTYNTIPV